MAGMMYLGNQKVTPVIIQGGGSSETPVTSFKLADEITTVSENELFYELFYDKGNQSFSVDLNNLEVVSGDEAFSSFIQDTKAGSTAKIKNLRVVSGNSAFFNFAYSMNNRYSVDVDFSKIEELSGDGCFAGAFLGCNVGGVVRFTSLTTLTGDGALRVCFAKSDVSEIYFNSLTSQSFGEDLEQFMSMLLLVTGCTVHFPSNLESVIGNWSDVLAGFGGTNTTILFDLEATS